MVPRATRIYVEDWSAQYGTPYLLDDEESPSEVAVMVEDGDALAVHDGRENGDAESLAFVDGVRRAEAALYWSDDSGGLFRGIAGAFAVGAVICDGKSTPVIVDATVSRLVIWEGDHAPELAPQPGGWRWSTAKATTSGPDGPLATLQNQMRAAEARLADKLSRDRVFVVTDGPLYYGLEGEVFEIAGYVKTHRAPVLAPEHRTRVAEIGVGQRTSIFRMNERKYACYARIGGGNLISGPWSGVVRIEFPLLPSFERVVALADTLALRLVSYAGVLHRDPRAPQNLQPIGGLERHLRHLLGDQRLASRAVRDAVHHSETSEHTI